MFFFQDFTEQVETEMSCSAESCLQLLQHEAIWHSLNKRPPCITHNSSQFNSFNYMPLEFGLRSCCMVCAFGSDAG